MAQFVLIFNLISFHLVFNNLAMGACYVDAQLTCDPRSGAPQLPQASWKLGTPLLRDWLFNTSSVQNSLMGCELFADLIRAECRLAKPVQAVYFKGNSKEVASTYFSVVPRPNLSQEGPGLPQDFIEYFSKAAFEINETNRPPHAWTDYSHLIVESTSYFWDKNKYYWTPGLTWITSNGGQLALVSNIRKSIYDYRSVPIRSYEICYEKGRIGLKDGYYIGKTCRPIHCYKGYSLNMATMSCKKDVALVAPVAPPLPEPDPAYTKCDFANGSSAAINAKLKVGSLASGKLGFYFVAARSATGGSWYLFDGTKWEPYLTTSPSKALAWNSAQQPLTEFQAQVLQGGVRNAIKSASGDIDLFMGYGIGNDVSSAVQNAMGNANTQMERCYTFSKKGFSFGLLKNAVTRMLQ